MFFNDYRNSESNWDGSLTPQDVVNFVVTIGKTAFELKDDWEFWSENNRSLSSGDIFLPVYRLGRTHERYNKEIAIYKAILAAKDFVFPPKPQIPNMISYTSPYDSYYNPTLGEYNKYRNTLAWHTGNIPIYVAIRYGKEGIDWVLDKFGDEVKKYYYTGQNSYK